MNDKVTKWINHIDDVFVKNRIKEIVSFVTTSFVNLELDIKWNQLMFLNNKTFILGISISKNHLSFAPEKFTMDHFKNDFSINNIETTKMLFKIKHNQEINYDFLKEIIKFNINTKQNHDKFWR